MKISYPKGEQIWVKYYNENRELKFMVTSKEARDFYTLYELTDGKFKKLGKSKSPTELEQKYRVYKRINCTAVNKTDSELEKENENGTEHGRKKELGNTV